MIVPLRSPVRSQRVAARVTVVAATLMACVVCVSVSRYCIFMQDLPAVEATMRGVADDLTRTNGSNAIAAAPNNTQELAEFKRLTVMYGPVLSYRCVSSINQFYFPFITRESQTYDIHFANHDSTVILTINPGLSHQYKVNNLWVSDIVPSDVRETFVPQL